MVLLKIYRLYFVEGFYNSEPNPAEPSMSNIRFIGVPLRCKRFPDETSFCYSICCHFVLLSFVNEVETIFKAKFGLCKANPECD